MLPAPPEHSLRNLTQEQAKNWVTIGRLLFELEAYSRGDASGRPWQDVLRDKLTELGAPISAGHLYKVRRAYAFLHTHAPGDLEQGGAEAPKISSIEVAERLYRIDAQEGLKALADAVGPSPVPYVDLKKRYDEALESRPEMKSPRQVAWETRKKTSGSPKAPDDVGADAPEQPRDNASGQDETSGPPQALQKKVSTLFHQAWKAGWDAATAQHEPELEGLRNRVREHQEEIEILARKVRDLRGYDHDFDEDF
ncbi:hypothetical protein M3N55_12095 [Roseibaca sp. V10]|uniref:Uncharacterized protein n=1 Tax=Roseinatronobacter domitianus TaxID=2940293 RepID=A0ABT0M3N3_9RHOB|nr:hypothetical protein [Roseibaca domitiana]MCL1629472.1 hypothetical protein [Roseibaca domitiana]